MVECALPFHTRPYETLGTLLESFGGKKGKKSAAKATNASSPSTKQEDLTPEEKNATFFSKLRSLGFPIQIDKPDGVDDLVDGLDSLP